MKVIASDFYTYYKPSKCPLRVYLIEAGEIPSPPGPLDELVVRLGERHEKEHLRTFPEFVDLSRVPFGERVERTLEEIHRGAPVIYQGVFSAKVTSELGEISLSGMPDFLISGDDGYVIRDCKLSRRINEGDHPEITAQLGMYGYLFKKAKGGPLSSMEVYGGGGDVIEIPYAGDNVVLPRLNELAYIKSLREEPYTPVGWSKCSGCGFFQRCWPKAEERGDVAIVPEVTQNLASALRERGVETYEELLRRFTQEELSDFKVPHGKGMRKVGVRAEKILVNARAIRGGEEIITGQIEIPRFDNFVMFDLEGLPPYIDELDKIYLWGLKVVGVEPSDFMPALAGFGEDGDREGWEEFLRKCEKIFHRYGDIPFVHWASYERTKVNSYLERYGDINDTAMRVRENLYDLLKAFKRTLALPIPSYSLKVVEKYVGYNRTTVEYGGEWAIAKYIEAVETEDKSLRREIMDRILRYNEEDLDATWALMKWWKRKLEGGM